MTVVIGFGNPLRGDDGVGPAVAESVARARPDIEVVTPQQLVPELTATIARAGIVIFVDAAVGGQPGTVCCDPVRCGDSALVDHSLSPASLLRLTRDVYGWEPPAWLVRVQGQTFDVGVTLSPQVADAVPSAVSVVQRLIPPAPHQRFLNGV